MGLNHLLLATALLAVALEAAKLTPHNPNRARGGGPGKKGGRRVVKKLRNGRQGRQLFGSRVPFIPAVPIPPPALIRTAPAPLHPAPFFGPQPAPLVQPALRLLEIPAPPPAPVAPVLITQQGIQT